MRDDRIRQNTATTALVDAELRLAGVLDHRMIGLLQAIEQTGSINQAAKQMGLSYKGAWQIIERANNGAPKTLLTTAIGGSKGGGTCLTEAGKSLVQLFNRLEQRHQTFLDELNCSLRDDPDTLLLLQRLVVKTSARNQLFGTVTAIHPGAVHANVLINLKGGEAISVNISMTALTALGLTLNAEAVLLLNPADLELICASEATHCLIGNRLPCQILRIQQDEVNAEVKVLLTGGEILGVSMTTLSLKKLALKEGQPAWVIFTSQAPIMGIA